MITIEEFMTANPYTLSESHSLNDARKVMTERHIRHIPITDNNKHLLGLVTQRDVLAATDSSSMQQVKSSPGAGDQDVMLSDIMIIDVNVIHETDSLRQAALYLQSHKYGCLPVVRDDQLVGIITDSDFIAIAINLLEQVEVTEAEIANETESEIENVEVLDLLEFEETQ